MENDPEPDWNADRVQNQVVRLKAEREALTPGQDSWEDDSSVQSNLSEDEEEVKVEVAANAVIPEDKPEPTQSTQKVEKLRKERPQIDFKLMQHYVDHNFLVLMIVLRRHRLIDLQKISGLKEGSISLLGKHNKIMVRAVSNADAEAAIENISNFIDKLNIQKTAIKYEAANRIVRFRKLKEFLSRDRVVIFGARSKDLYEVYIGGEMKPSQLRTHIHKIGQIKVQPVFLRVFQNKRSYRIIVEGILNSEFMQKALLNYNNVNFAEVERRNPARQLRLVLGSFAKKELTPNEYQDFFMKQLQNFYVVTFVFEAEEKYLEKLKCEGVNFIYLREHKFNRSYVFIIALKEDFLKRSEQISLELQKIGQRIIGIRFFKKIKPAISKFKFDAEKYHLFWFPPGKPYSTVVTARRKEGSVFDWREMLGRIVGRESRVDDGQ